MTDRERREFHDLSPMWALYVSYLKKMLPWEQKTVVGKIDPELLAKAGKPDG